MILQKNLSSRSFIRLLAAAVGSFVRSFLDSSLFDGVFYFSLFESAAHERLGVAKT